MTDRRDRIREYKETPLPMGVYRVLNTATGKSLLGSSANLPGMLNRQRFQLELGSHPNRELQQDWNDLGPDVFKFETLDLLEPQDAPGYDPADDLLTLEQIWIERLALPLELRYTKSKRGT